MSAEAEIRAFADRIARLEIERRELAADIKDVKAEAKGRGYSTKLLTACVRLILLEADKRAAALADHEELDLYLGACGLISRADDAEDEPFRSDAPPSSTSPQDTGAKAGSSVSGESPAPGPADTDAAPDFQPECQDAGQPVEARKASDEEPAGTSGTQVSGQSEEFVAATGAEEAVAAAVDPAPASDDQVSPERASEVSPKRSQETGGHESPRGNLVSATEKPLSVTAGERPGTPSTTRRAFEAAVAARLAPKPLDPADKLYPILFKARHGRDPSPAEMAGASA